MSIKDELIGAELVNQNTDEEAVKIIGELDKLDSIQQNIINGFAALLNKGGTIFLTDGEFTVPEGITEITVWGCGAGGAYYAGESAIEQKIAVTPGEVLQIRCGENKATEIVDKLYLGNGTATNNANSDYLDLGVTLGIKGNNGTGNTTASDYTLAVGGSGGSGGLGGSFGFGGSGGGGGGGIVKSYGSSPGKGGTYVGESKTVYIFGTPVSIIGGGIGSNGTSITGTTSADRKPGAGGKGGNGGGFGAGAGRGGKGGKFSTDGLSTDSSKTGADGADGTGSQGFLVMKWGVD